MYWPTEISLEIVESICEFPQKIRRLCEFRSTFRQQKYVLVWICFDNFNVHVSYAIRNSKCCPSTTQVNALKKYREEDGKTAWENPRLKYPVIVLGDWGQERTHCEPYLG